MTCLCVSLTQISDSWYAQLLSLVGDRKVPIPAMAPWHCSWGVKPRPLELSFIIMITEDHRLRLESLCSLPPLQSQNSASPSTQQLFSSRDLYFLHFPLLS